MIMMVDDEPRRMDAYLCELRDTGYTVQMDHNVDKALERLESDLPHIQLLILDVMMAPGQAFQSLDTQEGLRTGERFYERVRSLSADLPVMFLTNVSDPQLTKKYQRERYCRVLHKEDYQPFELADEVRRMIGPP